MSNRSNSGDLSKQTTVEEGTEFKGTLRSSCPVVVRGALEGEIQAPALTIASTGIVTGTVRARSIHSQGTLAGNVDADEVSLSGSVRSDTVIRAKSLEVKLQRDKGKLEVTFGECILEVGDEPEAEARTESSNKADKRSSALGSESLSAEGAGEASGGEPEEGRRSDENGKSERLSVPPAS